jgi:hypothetical protein
MRERADADRLMAVRGGSSRVQGQRAEGAHGGHAQRALRPLGNWHHPLPSFGTLAALGSHQLAQVDGSVLH